MPTHRLFVNSFILLFGLLVADSGHSIQFAHHPRNATVATFPRGVSTVEVPMLGPSDQPIIEVSVNGGEPSKFILDTGSETSVWLGEAHARPTGSEGIRLDMGGLVIEGAGLHAVDGSNLGSMPFEGILGTEAFSNVIVELNWVDRVVRIHDRGRFEPPSDATAHPIDTSGGYVSVSGEVRVAETLELVNLLVDTGAGYALTLRENTVTLPARLISDSPIGKGLHGVVRGSMGRIDELMLGTQILPNVITAFVDEDSWIMPRGQKGGIGMGVLSRFVLFLDLSGKQLLLQATDAVAEPFKFTMSGLKFFPTLNEDGEAEVFGVYPGSPAAKADIRAGDRIVALNDAPLLEIGIDGLRQAFGGEPGDEVELMVRQADTTRKVVIRLETLL